MGVGGGGGRSTDEACGTPRWNRGAESQRTDVQNCWVAISPWQGLGFDLQLESLCDSMKLLVPTDFCDLSQNKLQEKVCKLCTAIRPCQHLAAHAKHSDSIQHMELCRRIRRGTVLFYTDWQRKAVPSPYKPTGLLSQLCTLAHAAHTFELKARI